MNRETVYLEIGKQQLEFDVFFEYEMQQNSAAVNAEAAEYDLHILHKDGIDYSNLLKLKHVEIDIVEQLEAIRLGN